MFKHDFVIVSERGGLGEFKIISGIERLRFTKLRVRLRWKYRVEAVAEGEVRN